jgi:hypothetical protein
MNHLISIYFLCLAVYYSPMLDHYQMTGNNDSLTAVQANAALQNAILFEFDVSFCPTCDRLGKRFKNLSSHIVKFLSITSNVKFL